jgi:hypothetical protein
MKRDTFEIIRALEGSIEPLAETNIDEKHLANLKEWCDLHEQITDEILKVANNEGLRCYNSAKEIIDYARKHLAEVNTYLTEYVQKWDDKK